VLAKTPRAIVADDEIPCGFDFHVFELLEEICEPAVPGLIERH
jgi:hypothetical protein